MIIKYVQHITNPCSTYKQALVLPRSPFFETASFTNRSHDQFCFIFVIYLLETIQNDKKNDKNSQKSLLIEIISLVQTKGLE